jgi:hypothetical protein
LHLKTFDRSKRYRLLWVAAALGLLAACSEEDDGGSPTDGGTSQPITVEEILVSPKAANPGDTLRLSAIVTSSDDNVGDIPSVEWTATGGAFLEDDGSSVRWVAPAGGTYVVTARATNSANTAQGSTDVFVADRSIVVTGGAGTPRLQPNQTDLHYLHTGPIVGASQLEVFRWQGGVAEDAVDNPSAANGPIGKYLTYAEDGTFEVHSADSIIVGAALQPVHIYIGDFATKNYTRITVDTAPGVRHQAYLYPDVAPDSRLIAFEGYITGPTSSGPDSFDIFVYDKAVPTRQRVTLSHTNHKNAFPTWSTDERWLTFVSDRGGNLRWELYGMPITGGVVNTDQASLVRLSDTAGTLASGSIRVSETDFPKPKMVWNPVAPTLAILATDGVTYLITTTTTGASQVVVGNFDPDDPETPREFVWSPDGNRLAVTTGARIRTIASDGSNTLILERAGDTFADLAWSPDSRWLVYRAIRASSVWFEVIDFNETPLPAPLPVTAAEPNFGGANSLAAYRSIMSMSPAWSTAGDLFYPTFATGSSTVGIISVDMSGLAP